MAKATKKSVIRALILETADAVIAIYRAVSDPQMQVKNADLARFVRLSEAIEPLTEVVNDGRTVQVPEDVDLPVTVELDPGALELLNARMKRNWEPQLARAAVNAQRAVKEAMSDGDGAD